MATLYVIGDSFSDIGVFSDVFEVVIDQYQKKPNFNLDSNFDLLKDYFQKMKLKPPYYQNRSFSNGLVAIEIVNQVLSLTDHFTKASPGWDANFNHLLNQIEVLKEGTNYAVGGAKIVPKDSGYDRFLSPFSLSNQTRAIVKNKIFKNDILYINIGSNDLIDFNVDLDLVLETLKLNLEILNKVGFSKIIVANMMDFSTVPYIQEQNNFQKSFKIKNNVEKFNQKLKIMIAPFSKMVIHDLNTIFERLKKEFVNQEPDDKYKIDYVFKTPIVGQNYQKKSTLVDDYLFLDSIHPGRWFHQKVALTILELIKAN